MIKSYKLVEFLIELDELEELWNVPFNWTHVGLLAEECAVLTADNKLELRECSTKSRPGICAYDPRVNTTIPADNLCPYPWKGSKIIDGQLVCFQIKKSNFPIKWHQAVHSCQNEVFLGHNLKAISSIATFESAWKDRLFREQFQSMESSWIGLHWSENHRKFCWNHSEDCQFDHFNWKLGTDFDGGFYGAMNSDHQWISLPNTQLTHVICQAVFTLKSVEEVEIVADDSVRIQAKKDRWFTSTQNQSSVACFGTNGYPFSVSLKKLPHRLLWNYSDTINCQGWTGWPRKFTKSNVVYQAENSSFTFLLSLKSYESERLIPDQYEPTRYRTNGSSQPDRHRRNILKLLNKTFEEKFNNQVRIDADIVRFHTSDHELEILTRLTIQPQNLSIQERNLLEFFQPPVDFTTPSPYKYYLTDLRSIRFCASEIFNDVQWPTVRTGVVAEPMDMCLTSDGSLLLRKCSGDAEVGAYWEHPHTLQGEVESCMETTSTAKKLMQLVENVQSHNMSCKEALSNTAQLCDTWKSTAGELRQATRVLQVIVQPNQSFTLNDFYNASKILAAVSISTGES